MTEHAKSDGNTAEISERWIDTIVVLSARLEVDLIGAPKLAKAIQEASNKAPSALIVDLTEVPFLASMGITVLVSAHEQAAGTFRFGVVADGPATSRPLKMIGLDQVLSLYRTVDDAVHALR